MVTQARLTVCIRRRRIDLQKHMAESCKNKTVEGGSFHRKWSRYARRSALVLIARSEVGGSVQDELMCDDFADLRRLALYLFTCALFTDRGSSLLIMGVRERQYSISAKHLFWLSR